MPNESLRAGGSWFRTASGVRTFDFSAGVDGGPMGYNHPLWRRYLRGRLGALQTPRHHRVGSQEALAYARTLFTRAGFTETPTAFELQDVPPSLEIVDELDAMGATNLEPGSHQVLRLGCGLDSLDHLPEGARSFRHFLVQARWMPEKFLPSFYISRDGRGPSGALPRSETVHPLATAYRQVSVMIHRPERVRNRRELSRVLTSWIRLLPESRRAIQRGHAVLLPLGGPGQKPGLGLPQFPGRLFFGRLSLLTVGQSVLIFPSLDENAEVLGHRLAELRSFLVP